MGITGLIPFLKNASRQANIKDFKGCTVAIDSYCWLHRGAFACAEKLALGEKTDQYVYYCMKYVNSLLSFGIKPIMVFDGCRLPSKQEVEKTRRARRDLNRKKAAELLREGKRSEARDCLAQCIDISPQMALELMKACREKGVDCIVAPYEADAQLAYLNRIGLAQIIITEDSDLVLFGCDKFIISWGEDHMVIKELQGQFQKVMFKMDVAGNGILYDRKDLNKSLGLHPEHFTFDKFRYMCILSGCDYLASLPGIGLGKASKVFKVSRQNDMALVLKKLPSILNMSNLVVPPHYIEAFFRANDCFLYQLVFDPIQRKLVPLNPYPESIDPRELHYAGPSMSDEKALQIALGNLNIHNGEVLFDYDPDVHIPKTNSWTENTNRVHQQSIWNRNYTPTIYKGPSLVIPAGEDAISGTSSRSKEVVIRAPVIKSKVIKRARLVNEDDQVSDLNLVHLYSEKDPSYDKEEQCPPKDDDWHRTTRTPTARNQRTPTDDKTSGLTTPTNRKRMHSSSVQFVEKLFPKSSPDCAIAPLNLTSTRESDHELSFEELLAFEEDIKLDMELENPKRISFNETTSEDDSDKKLINSKAFVSDTHFPRTALSPSKANIDADFSAISAKTGSADHRPTGEIGKENSARRRLVTPMDALSEIVSPDKKRNVFAVDSAKKTKFQIAGLKSSPPALAASGKISTKTAAVPVEIKSRFFTAAKPRQETTFFKELKKEHTELETSMEEEHQDSGVVLYKDDQDMEKWAEEEEEGFLNKSTGEIQGLVKSCHLVEKLTTVAPQQSFNFTRLISFRSNFDRRNASELPSQASSRQVIESVRGSSSSKDAFSASVAVGRPFKPVIPASFMRPSVTDDVSSHASKTNFVLEYLPESPVPRHNNDSSFESTPTDSLEDPLAGMEFDQSSPSEERRLLPPSSTVGGASVRSLGVSNVRGSVGKDLEGGGRKRFSLDSFRKPGVVDASKNVVPAEKIVNIDSSASESILFKVSTSMKEYKSDVISTSGQCRTTGLSKNKLKSKGASSKTDKSKDVVKQSAISTFFHSTFAYDRRRVGKITH